MVIHSAEHDRGHSHGCPMPRRNALKLPLLVAAGAALATAPPAAAAPARWSADQANAWYQRQPWLVGVNYIPAYAVNQLEMFGPGTYNPQRIDAELRLAQQIGFNTARVFLHDLLWAQDRAGFQARLAQFVGIAANRGIRPLFVLFDSCWNPHPALGPQTAPWPGVHNSGWVQSPGADRIDDAGYTPVLRDYVTGVIGQFRSDDRVLGWDVWNEPDNPAREYRKLERKDKQQVVQALLPQAFDWARSANPTQPLTSGVWEGTVSSVRGIQLDNSDVITFHSYAKPADFEAQITELATRGRPILCTEYLGRTKGSTIEGILPIAKRHNVGAYSWGLVAGKTQTYLPWDSWDHPTTTPPTLWFSDLLQPDGSAYRTTEIQTIQQLTKQRGAA